MKKQTKPLWLSVIQGIGITFKEALIEGISSLIAALFFFYAFGPGGFYLLFLRMDKMSQREQDERFWIYAVMTLFNIVCILGTLYLIIKAAE